jgi:hypothetical protein
LHAPAVSPELFDVLGSPVDADVEDVVDVGPDVHPDVVPKFSESEVDVADSDGSPHASAPTTHPHRACRLCRIVSSCRRPEKRVKRPRPHRDREHAPSAFSRAAEKPSVPNLVHLVRVPRTLRAGHWLSLEVGQRGVDLLGIAGEDLELLAQDPMALGERAHVLGQARHGPDEYRVAHGRGRPREQAGERRTTPTFTTTSPPPHGYRSVC